MGKRHTKPLKNDPRRVAVAALNGYSFQIWRSIHRWVTLKEDEVLFLEGAEDIDILGPKCAETIQVSETKASGPITLRSKKVLAAIGHCWEHQERNPGVIQFRFLTTSERSRERGDPFDGSGLDYWDRGKRKSVGVSPLRSFLQSQKALPDSLRKFLRTSSDEELRERLIKRIEWDTGNRPQRFVEEAVNKEVISYGNRVYDLPPTESLRVVPHLLKRAWETVLQKQDRHLDYPDFMQLFEETLTERISSHELRQYRRAALAVAQPTSVKTEVMLLAPDAALDVTRLPLLERLAKRERLVSSLSELLNNNGLLVLRGSTGTGKSTLANLITKADVTAWRRLNLRGIEPQQIRDSLLYHVRFVTRDTANDYIIDDLNFDKKVMLYEEILAELLYVVTSRGGRIIVTTQGNIPSRVRLQLDIPDKSIFNVPLLTEEEVAQIVANHGCHDASAGAMWTRIIFFNTNGHPQLVHARVKKLTANGWPAAEPVDIVKTEDIENVRREARIQLREQLPSEDARTLAFRLSIFSGPFKRVQALFLGTRGVPIATPGDAFDLLIGPWVERLNEKYYQLSPLLTGAASEVFADQEVTALHRAAAESYLTEKSLELFELNGALIHGLLGKTARPIAAVVMACNGVEPANWPALSRGLHMLAYFGDSKVGTLFPADPLISLMLRQVQFKVAAEIDAKGRAVRIAEEWEKELTAFDDGQRPYPAKLFMELLYRSSIIIETKVPLSLNRVVRTMATIPSISNALESFTSQHPILQTKDAPGLAQHMSVERILPLTITRCKNGDDVIEFLVTLSEQEPETAVEVWDQFRKDETLAAFLIDRAWLHEEKKPAPDWARCLDQLEVIARVGLSAKVDSVVAYAYRAKSIVEKEYLKNTHRAEQAISEGEEKLGHAHRLLTDYRAKILYFDEQWDEAFQIWEPLLEEDLRRPDPDCSLSYREAEICAAKLGRWEAAAEIALKGERAARLSYPSLINAVQFRANYAFDCWMAGRPKESVESFAQVLRAFDDLPSTGTDLLSHAFQLRIGYTLVWLWETVKESEARPQPDAGFFTNPSKNEEEIRDHTSPTRIYLWQFLAEIEYALNLGDHVFKRLVEETTKSSSSTTSVLFAMLRLKHDLRIGQLDNLIEHSRDLTEALKRPVVGEFSQDVSDATTVSGMIEAASNRSAVLEQLKGLLFAAIVKVVGLTQSTNAPLSIWRSELKRDGFLDEEIEGWLTFMEQSKTMATHDLTKLLKDRSANAEQRLAASLLLSTTDELNAEDEFYADVLLVTTKHHALWREETGPAIEALVTRRWSLLVREQPFGLRNPRLNVNAILDKCNDPTSVGLQKAARILLAAKSAVRIGVPDFVLQQLKSLAE